MRWSGSRVLLSCCGGVGFVAQSVQSRAPGRLDNAISTAVSGQVNAVALHVKIARSCHGGE